MKQIDSVNSFNYCAAICFLFNIPLRADWTNETNYFSVNSFNYCAAICSIQHSPTGRLNEWNKLIRSIRSIIAQQYVFYSTSPYGQIKQMKQIPFVQFVQLLRSNMCILYWRPAGRPDWHFTFTTWTPHGASLHGSIRSYNFPLILSILFNVSSTKMICLIFTRKSSLIYSSM